MIAFVGLGYDLNLNEMGIKVIENSDKIYLDTYTTPLPSFLLEKIKKKIIKLNKNMIEANRALLESSALVDEAKNSNIAILCVGDPMFATTHIAVFAEAKRKNINVKVISNSSIINVAWRTGIFPYKLGRIVTISFWKDNYRPMAPIEFIDKNKSVGLHTLALLDIEDDKKPMSLKHAIEIIWKMENNYGKKVVEDVIAIKNAGFEDEKIVFGSIEKVYEWAKKQNDGIYSLIILSQLSPIEKEHIEIICEQL